MEPRKYQTFVPKHLKVLGMEVFLIIYHSLKHNTITTKGGIIMVDSMEKIVALCKSRGFVYPGSEIYGGLANSWDYGPLGVELKIISKMLGEKSLYKRINTM